MWGSEFAGDDNAFVQMRATKKSVQLKSLGRVKNVKLVRDTEVATLGGEPTLEAPIHLNDTCETVMLRILKGEQPPYYREDGRPALAPRVVHDS